MLVKAIIFLPDFEHDVKDLKNGDMIEINGVKLRVRNKFKLSDYTKLYLEIPQKELKRYRTIMERGYTNIEFDSISVPYWENIDDINHTARLYYKTYENGVIVDKYILGWGSWERC